MMLPPEPDRWTIDLADAQRMEAIAALYQVAVSKRTSLNMPNLSLQRIKPGLSVTICPLAMTLFGALGSAVKA